MSNKILDSNVNYVERFLSKQSKRIGVPTFKYLDAKLHPKYKDHIVVLSTNEFPESTKVTYCWDDVVCGISDLDQKYPEQFKEIIEQVEGERRNKGAKDKKPGSTSRKSKEKNAALDKTDEILEETKNLGLNESEVDSEKYYDDSKSSEEYPNPKKKGAKNKSKMEKKSENDVSSIERDIIYKRFVL